MSKTFFTGLHGLWSTVVVRVFVLISFVSTNYLMTFDLMSMESGL